MRRLEIRAALHNLIRVVVLVGAAVVLASAAGCSVESSGTLEDFETTKPKMPEETAKESGGDTGGSPATRDSKNKAEDKSEEKSGEKVTDSVAETESGSANESLVVVDEDRGLSPDYAPDDLQGLHPLGIQTLRGESMTLRQEAARAASEMISEAASRGIELVVCSAYRSHEDQVISHGRLTAIYGEQAEGFVAHPGHSEHQLGTAIDVSNASAGYRLTQQFGNTQAYRWLDENAVDYGFVLSYPKEAKDITGYQWEPWHYRYIGRENARMYAEGDYESPQSFFLREGVIPKDPAKRG